MAYPVVFMQRVTIRSNTAPIGFADIAEGLTRISGTMAQTGTSIEETIGMLTGGFSQLRDIEKVSSGLLMISQRLRGINEDGDAVDGLASKVADEFKNVGVSVEDANGELRSTYDILKDYAKVYNTLGSKQIQFLGEEAAGNRQVTVLNAIIQQWNDVEKAIQSATNSTGSAEEENAIFMKEIEGHINELKSQWVELSRVIINDDYLKGGISGGTALLKVLTQVVDTLGVIPVVGGAASTVLGKMGARLFGDNGLFNPRTIDGKFQIRNWFNFEKDSGTLQKLSNMLKGLDEAQQEAVKGSIEFTSEIKKLPPSVQSAAMAFTGLNGEVNNLQKKLPTLGGILKSIGASFLDMGLGLAIGAGIQLLIKWLDETIHKCEIATEATQQAIIEWDNAKRALSGYKDELVGVSERLDELHKLQSTTGLTDELQDELVLLEKKNTQLQRSIDLEESRAKIAQDNARKALQAEIDLYNNRQYSSLIQGSPTDYLPDGTAQYADVYVSEVQHVEEAIAYVKELNAEKAKGRELELFEEKDLTLYSDSLKEIAERYTLWSQQASDNGDTDLSETYRHAAKEIYRATDELEAFEQTAETVSDKVKAAFSGEGLLKPFTDQLKTLTRTDILENIGDMSNDDIINSKLPEVYKAIATAANEANVESDYYISLLEEQGKIIRVVANENASLADSYGKLRSVVKESGDSLSKLNDALSTVFNFTSTRADIEAALDSIEQITGIKLDINADNLTDTLKTIEAYVKGDADAFVKFGTAAMKALGIKVDPKNITSAIQQVVNLAATASGNLQIMAQNLMSIFSAMGAVKPTGFTSNAQKAMDAYKKSGRTDLPNLNDATLYDYSVDPSKVAEIFTNAYNSAKTSGSGGSKSLFDGSMLDLTGYEAYEKQLAQLDIAITHLQEKMGEANLSFDELANLEADNVGLIDQVGEVYDKLIAAIEAKQNELQGKVEDMGVEIIFDPITGVAGVEGYQSVLDKLADSYKKAAAAAKGLTTDSAQAKAAEKAKKAYEDCKNAVESFLDENKKLLDAKDWWKQYAEAVEDSVMSAMSNIKGNITSLLDMVTSMLKQEYTDQIDRLNEQKDIIEDNYDNQLKYLDELKDQQNEANEQNKTALENEYDIRTKIIENQKKAAQDAYDAERKRLELMKEQLQRGETEHDYQAELRERTTEINNVQSKIAVLSNDDSLAAAKKRRELEEELAKKQTELQEFIHDRSIALQEDAIDDALSKLDDKKEAQDDAFSVQLEQIEAEKTARLDMLEAQQDANDKLYDQQKSHIEALQQTEIYNLDQRIKALTAAEKDQYSLRAQAIAMIEGRESDLYNKLIAYNRDYGTSIDADVYTAFTNCYAVMGEMTDETSGLASLLEKLSVDGLVNSVEHAIQDIRTLKSVSSGQTDWVIQGTRVSEGTQEVPIRFHDGGAVGASPETDRFTKFMQLAGKIKGDERILTAKNDEWILTKNQQKALMGGIANGNSNMVNTTRFDFSMPINIAGNADESTITALKNTAKGIADDVMRTINKQWSISGLKPVRG